MNTFMKKDCCTLDMVFLAYCTVDNSMKQMFFYCLMQELVPGNAFGITNLSVHFKQ